MKKIVINRCFGGFDLSKESFELGAKISGDPSWYPKSRHDPILVEVVETLGQRAGGDYARLCIEEILSDKYQIVDYDGWETVNTPENIVWEIIE